MRSLMGRFIGSFFFPPPQSVYKRASFHSSAAEEEQTAVQSIFFFFFFPLGGLTGGFRTLFFFPFSLFPRMREPALFFFFFLLLMSKATEFNPHSSLFPTRPQGMRPRVPFGALGLSPPPLIALGECKVLKMLFPFFPPPFFPSGRSASCVHFPPLPCLISYEKGPGRAHPPFFFFSFFLSPSEETKIIRL